MQLQQSENPLPAFLRGEAQNESLEISQNEAE